MRRTVVLGSLGLLLLAVGGCGSDPSDRLSPPKLGACRELAANDLVVPTNNTAPVACDRAHTAQTFLIGTLPASTGSAYHDRRQSAYVYRTCRPALGTFLGADESLMMRIQLSWVWFGPSRKGWAAGARWFRCDLVGGPTAAPTLRSLPTTAKGLFGGRPSDTWLTCARGAAFAGSQKLSCSQPHDWRAIATVKLGRPGDPYPGDRISQVLADNYCSDQVGAWNNYALDYAYAYTWFHKAEWQAGNRRAVCWARTTQ